MAQVTGGAGNVVIQTGSGLITGVIPVNGAGGTGAVDASTVTTGNIAI